MEIKFKLPGIVLLSMGIILAVLAYLMIDSIFLTAVGISVAISGVTGIAVSQEISNASQQASNSPGLTHLLSARSNTLFGGYMLVISQAVVLIGMDALLTWKDQNDLSAFFVVNAIIFIIINWVYNTMKAESKSGLNKVSAFLITGCLIIIGYKFIDILK